MDIRETLVHIIVKIAMEFNEGSEFKIAVEKGTEASLFGREGVLDSLGLVAFVAAVEQAIQDEIGVELTLADEKAMSNQHSPFGTIGALVEYAATLIEGDIRK